MIAVYTAIIVRSSYNQHKNFIKGYKRRFINVGNHCNNLHTARLMSHVIYEKLQSDFLKSLKKYDSPLTLLMDESTGLLS